MNTGKIREKTGAVVTVAGLSSRMKTFKPLLELDGSTIIETVIHHLQMAEVEPIVLVVGHRASDLMEKLAGEDVMFVYNENYASSQMFDSVKLGLERASNHCNRILITPGDVPLTKVETIRRIMDQESMIVRPRYNGKPGHPLMISSLLVPKICAYEGEGGLGRAIDSLSMPVQEFEVDDEGMTLDADTPADYQLIKEFSTLFPEN